jgi:hypothetical protein
MYVHTYIHAYVHTYIHTYMHTYIHTYMHTYIHTYGTAKIYQNVRSFGLAVTPHSNHDNVTISATKQYVFKGTKRALDR